ncbi:MAG TPA: hypothetical protein VF658_06470 [Pyrinomonadaceae bacterium]
MIRPEGAWHLPLDSVVVLMAATRPALDGLCELPTGARAGE